MHGYTFLGNQNDMRQHVAHYQATLHGHTTKAVETGKLLRSRKKEM